MAKGCGAKFAKILLIIFNFVFWLSGAAILGVGIWIKVDKSILRYEDVVTINSPNTYLEMAAWTLIGIGSFVFIVGFLGCCGAIKESKCMLGLYIFFLVVVMAGELAAGILAAIYRGQIDSTLRNHMDSQIYEKYVKNSSVALSWDWTQISQECCGATGPKDYKNSKFYNISSPNGEYVPYSCCKMRIKDTTDPTKSEPEDKDECQKDAKKILNGGIMSRDRAQVNVDGCYKNVKDWFMAHLSILIGVGIGIASLEILGVIFAICLCRNIRGEDV